MKLHLVLLTLLCMVLAVAPGAAQVIYNNGPINGTVDAWTINFGYVVSDSFWLPSGGNIVGFDFGVWAYAGDTVLTVDWSITSDEFGGITYGTGTANVTQAFITSNQYGYDIDMVSFSFPVVDVNAGTYWLNLQNATTSFGDPLFWDENSGPSLASVSEFGTLASEAFDVNAGGGCAGVDCDPPTPEPGSLILFGTGIVGLAGLLRRRLF